MPSPRPGEAVVRVPATCGELAQGLIDGMPFLVSCPIDRYAEVRIAVDETGQVAGPAERGKAAAAARRTLTYLGQPQLGCRLDVRADLPPGRGFGTSTADVVGAIVATARALGQELSPDEVARLAVAVEPSDSTMFPGLAVLDHRGGQRWESLGPAPPVGLVVLDFGGEVDTVTYNARLDLSALSSRSSLHEQALTLLRRGVRQANLDAIGRAATLSALANEVILPKPALPAVLTLATRVGAYGVCAAHSGTALGLLLPLDSHLAAHALAEARRLLPGLSDSWVTRLVDGGARSAALLSIR